MKCDLSNDFEKKRKEILTLNRRFLYLKNKYTNFTFPQNFHMIKSIFLTLVITRQRN